MHLTLSQVYTSRNIFSERHIDATDNNTKYIFRFNTNKFCTWKNIPKKFAIVIRIFWIAFIRTRRKYKIFAGDEFWNGEQANFIGSPSNKFVIYFVTSSQQII